MTHSCQHLHIRYQLTPYDGNSKLLFDNGVQIDGPHRREEWCKDCGEKVRDEDMRLAN